MKKIISKILIIFPSFLIIFSLVAGTLFYFSMWILPKPHIKESYVVQYVDKENNLLFQKHFDSEGTYVPLEKTSPYLSSFYVAIEDKDFYKHSGIDWARVVKAFLVNTLSGKIKQGASSITQQVARMLYLDNTKSYSRKIKEAIYAARIETYYSKKEILEMYLNGLYFGHGIYGVEDASWFYFNKPSLDLSIAEASLLVGISNAPSLYSPIINKENSIKKHSQILSLLAKKKVITEEEKNTALQETLIIYGEKKKSALESTLYYQEAIEKQLKNKHIYNKSNLVKGISISTNIDTNISQTIYQILQKYQPNDSNTQVSVVVMKPYSNKVVSLFGGWDYNQSSYNRATTSLRQPASTIKPLLYYLGLSKGMTPSTLLRSEQTSFFIKNYGLYEPTNNNDVYANQEISMIQAIGVSDNIYAVKTNLILGTSMLVNLLNKFGLSDIEAVPSLALGTNLLTPLQLTSIYNTFASEGIYYKPSLINKVTDTYGNTLYQNNDMPYRILLHDETIVLNQLLTAPFDKNLISYANPTMINYPTNKVYAAKTGTTESDSWVVGFNPNYTITVWVGTDDNTKLTDYSLSKKIFQEIANTIDTTSNIWYDTNDHIIIKRVSPLKGTLSTSGSLYYYLH